MEIPSVVRCICRGRWRAANNLNNIGCRPFMHYKGQRLWWLRN